MAHTFNRTQAVPLKVRTDAHFGGLFARISAWNAARRTRNELSRLSAHELDDIGLVPGDIDRIASKQF